MRLHPMWTYMRRHGARVLSCVAVAMLGTVVGAGAHDFWLVPDAFQMKPGEALVVRGQTGSSFPGSEAAVAVERIREARVVGADGEERITDLSHQGKSLLLRHRLRTAGQRIVAVSIGWRHVRESAESFRRYLVLEGAPEALQRYERAGLLPADSTVRRYAKYAKTVVEVGGGNRAYSRVIGHPLEFIPLEDPGRASGRLRLRLLFGGSPLANARVHAGAAPARGVSAAPSLELMTSEAGVIELPLDAAGSWNVRTLHIVPSAPTADAAWDVHWATFVFSTR